MKRMILGISFLALAALPGGILAQNARLGPGTDIRLLASPSRDIRGALVSWDADSIRIQDPASGFVYRVPSLDIEQLRVSQPRTRGGGALRGLVIGSIVGALSLGGIFIESEIGCTAWCFDSVAEAFLIGAAVGGAMGGGTGAAVGAVWPGTRWVEVSPPLGAGGQTSSGSVPSLSESDQ
jgi:hypothetical protein